MFIMQEIHYMVKGSMYGQKHHYIKRATVLYKVNGGHREIIGLFYAEHELPKINPSCVVVLPSMEVTSAQFKWFEDKVSKAS